MEDAIMVKYENLFIDDVDAFAGDICLGIGHGAIDDPLPAFFGSPGNMRRDNAVLGVKKGVIACYRLG